MGVRSVCDSQLTVWPEGVGGGIAAHNQPAAATETAAAHGCVRGSK